MLRLGEVGTVVGAGNPYGSDADHDERSSQDHRGKRHGERDSSIGEPPVGRSRRGLSDRAGPYGRDCGRPVDGRMGLRY